MTIVQAQLETRMLNQDNYSVTEVLQAGRKHDHDHILGFHKYHSDFNVDNKLLSCVGGDCNPRGREINWDISTWDF